MNRQEAMEKVNKVTNLLAEALGLIQEMESHFDIEHYSNISQEYKVISSHWWNLLSMSDEEYQEEYGDFEEGETE